MTRALGDFHLSRLKWRTADGQGPPHLRCAPRSVPGPAVELTVSRAQPPRACYPHAGPLHGWQHASASWAPW